MSKAEIRASGRTPIEDAVNRRTTEFLILFILAMRPVTKKSLENQFQAITRRLKKIDGSFFTIYPKIGCEDIRFNSVIKYFKDLGIIEEREKNKKIILHITKRGNRGYFNLMSNSNGVGLNKEIKKAVKKRREKSACA